MARKRRILRGALRVAALGVAGMSLLLAVAPLLPLLQPGVSWRVALPSERSAPLIAHRITCERDRCEGVVGMDLFVLGAAFCAAGLLAAWGVYARRPGPLRAAAPAYLFASTLVVLAFFAEIWRPRHHPPMLPSPSEVALFVGLPTAILLLAARTYVGAAPRRPARDRLKAVLARGRAWYAWLAEEA